MDHLDGNAAAGELSEVFALDVTTAVATCAGCGTTGPVAQAMVYEAGMGTVLRCPACDSVLLRYARGGGELRVEMRGVSGAAGGEAAVDDPAGVALEDRLGLLRVAGAQRVGERLEVGGGLDPAQRRLDEAVEVGAERDVLRADRVDVACEDRDRLVQRLRVRAPQAVVDLVLGEDQPDHAAAGGERAIVWSETLYFWPPKR